MNRIVAAAFRFCLTLKTLLIRGLSVAKTQTHSRKAQSGSSEYAAIKTYVVEQTQFRLALKTRPTLVGKLFPMPWVISEIVILILSLTAPLLHMRWLFFTVHICWLFITVYILYICYQSEVLIFDTRPSRLIRIHKTILLTRINSYLLSEITNIEVKVEIDEDRETYYELWLQPKSIYKRRIMKSYFLEEIQDIKEKIILLLKYIDSLE
jgi:hypothetical protein